MIGRAGGTRSDGRRYGYVDRAGGSGRNEDVQHGVARGGDTARGDGSEVDGGFPCEAAAEELNVASSAPGAAVGADAIDPWETRRHIRVFVAGARGACASRCGDCDVHRTCCPGRRGNADLGVTDQAGARGSGCGAEENAGQTGEPGTEDLDSVLP